MSVYDKHYQQENLFGQPYPEFVTFMREWEPKGTVLDVGCGQGRDALFLAELSYKVTGIDASKRGIEQLLETAVQRNLLINGIVGDFYDYQFNQNYDVIVLDSILHFQKKALKKRAGTAANSHRITQPWGTHLPVYPQIQSQRATPQAFFCGDSSQLAHFSRPTYRLYLQRSSNRL